MDWFLYGNGLRHERVKNKYFPDGYWLAAFVHNCLISFLYVNHTKHWNNGTELQLQIDTMKTITEIFRKTNIR